VYSSVLVIHSWLRWATLALAVLATINAYRPDTDIQRNMPGRWWDSLFMMALDFQVLFGLLLYFGLSPYTIRALDDVGAVLRSSSVRFWAIEHLLWMTAATVLVRIGRVLALNAATSEKRRRHRLTFFAATTLAILAGIPWPGLSHGRPLFRGWMG
jgi:hypothetical protein